jgi:nitroimidazol reductase NimA-like FMN-containing flavoprotein (pyridoxamine 5'-phosphate oxidase superfamily)
MREVLRGEALWPWRFSGTEQFDQKERMPAGAVTRCRHRVVACGTAFGEGAYTVSSHAKAIMEELDEAECLRLISLHGIGRLAYVGRYDLTVIPVNYRFVEGAILFRTAQDSLTGEDLRTGIAHAEYKVAFEVDHVDEATREGWSVLLQGPAHHVESHAEQAAAEAAGVESWPSGEKDHFIRVTPVRITGRRIRRAL